MTLENILRRKLAEAKPASSRHELLFTEDGCPWTVHLVADRRDEWSSVVWELALRRGAPTGKDLAVWAQDVAGHVSGLMEPLEVIEIDHLRNAGLLRSAKPSERDGSLFYYEVLLQGTSSALVRRYQASSEPGAKRVQVPFGLTNEALAKLADNLASE